ncbi:MAG: HEPN domain-containing protein [Candidatus Brocadiia bacterium]
MSHEAADLWARALEALSVAHREATLSPDASASRAYYAAFHAVSALFAARGRSFGRHSAVEAAVHRDLVRTGALSKESGAAYSALLRLREVADYGGGRHVTAEQALEAVTDAREVLAEVSELNPHQFEMPESPPGA